MADFTALKTAIQNAIKQNGNNAITGNLLQDILISMVSTLGDSAINGLSSSLSTETTNRQNADGTLQSAINTINTKLSDGYAYVGIATPTTNPSTTSGKVFYIAKTAGTYTNFLNSSSQPLVLTQGINILKYNGTSWSVEQVWGVDDVPTAMSNNLIKSGGVQNELALGAVYDVSAKNPTAGPDNDGKWESLSALLSDANLNTLIPTSVRKGGMSIKYVCSSDNNYVQYRYMGNATTGSPNPFLDTNNWCNDDRQTEINVLENSINQVEDDLYGTSKNYTEHLYIDDTGNEVYREASSVSEFIKYTGKSVVVNFHQVTGSNILLFYDESQNYISGAYWLGTSNAVVNIPRADIQIYAPNAKYIRIAFITSLANNVSVENNGIVWKPKGNSDGFIQKTNENLAANNESVAEINERLIPIDYNLRRCINDIDGSNANYQKNAGIDRDGSITTDLSKAERWSACLDYVPYIAGNSVVVKMSSNTSQQAPDLNICFYDSDKQFINGAYWPCVPDSNGIKTCSLADIQTYAPNAAFFRYSFRTASIDEVYAQCGEVISKPHGNDVGLNVKVKDLDNFKAKEAGLELSGYSIIENSYPDRETGEIVNNYPGYDRTDYIDIGGAKELIIYSSAATRDNVFYDSSKHIIQYFALASSENNPNHIIVPEGAKYIIASCAHAKINDLRLYIAGEQFVNKKESKSIHYETVQIMVNSQIHNLDLIGVRSSNKQYSQTLGQYPTVLGYLYLDESTQKIYYSEGVWNKPEYLCDWNGSIADGTQRCQDYICIITDELDLLFMCNRLMSGRHNPIFYSHTDYTHPYVIDFGANDKPVGPSDIQAFETDYNNGFLLIGEYVNDGATDRGDNVYIWKVEKPYDEPSSWTKVLTKWVYRSSEASEHPNDIISHFHTVAYDYFTGNWYASTGDGLTASDPKNRVFVSTNNGDNWTEVANGLALRSCGYVFTKDAIYWATDQIFWDHKLYKANRLVDGTFDWDNKEEVCVLSTDGDCTWGVAYINNPIEGVFMIDKYEQPVNPGMPIGIYLYGVKEQKLYRLGYVSPIENRPHNLRYGLPYTIFTKWQPNNGDLVIGSCTNYYPCDIQILNNNGHNYLGNLKLSII